MSRRDQRDTRSPILRDAVRGSGGLGSGWFTTNGAENLVYDATSNILGTENGVPIVTDVDTEISTT